MNDNKAMDACPFCGSEDVFPTIGRTGCGLERKLAQCNNCEATADIELWNRRAFTASEAPGVPEGWRKFVEDCSKTAGLMVNGNNLSTLAFRLLSAAPSSPALDAGRGSRVLMDQWNAGARALAEAKVRDAALEEAAREIEKRSMYHDTASETAEMLRELKSAPSQQAQQDGWVSVADRLPLAYTDVLFVVDCPRDESLHGRVLGGRYVGGRWGFSTPGMGLGASHWQPMPAPPAHTQKQEGNA